MFRAKTISRTVTWFVVLIMISSSVITGGLYYFLRINGMIPQSGASSFWIPFFALTISVALGIIISPSMSNRLMRPLSELIKATRAVADGDFSIRVDGRDSTGEFAEFIRSFNKMAEDLGGLEIFRVDFINTFSHEFKTPIVSIRGFAKLLQNKDLTSEQREHYTSIIIKESERLANMSTNVLLLAQYENIKIISDKDYYSLSEQIRGCIQLLERDWLKKHIDLIGDINEVTYYGNKDVMSHVWMNLLSNAIKFTPENGNITVTLYENADKIIIKIEDSGPGMTEDTAKHIFSKFYQGDKSHQSPGNGLGLPIVKRIIDLCCGSIDVDTIIGEGSSFVVTLPVCAVDKDDLLI